MCIIHVYYIWFPVKLFYSDSECYHFKLECTMYILIVMLHENGDIYVPIGSSTFWFKRISFKFQVSSFCYILECFYHRYLSIYTAIHVLTGALPLTVLVSVSRAC